jgi:ABC-type molybdate transport system substrate-binding protein
MNGSFSEVAQDFINFIFSEEGQQVVMDNGLYLHRQPRRLYGRRHERQYSLRRFHFSLPAVEKLFEAYKVPHPDVDVEIQATGSTRV